MTNLLYVTCNLSSQNRSCTLSLGQEFLDEYLSWHPQDEVQVLDLYRDIVQRTDEDVMNVWRRTLREEESVALSDEERRKVTRIWRLADQFARCEKYVFVTHSINLWFPAEFKMYVDAVCVPNRTYRHTPEGMEGILPKLQRRSLHLHAGPPVPFGSEQDLSVPYLRAILKVLGVTDQETVLLHDDAPEKGPEAEQEAARQRLLKLARSF
ncbi:NAD(P)H-dependent oxidoreductase [Geomesophilobacter sediminis]|uniref:NAD(P)H-dependent oxidoreductase n=1 Tax=Geomesophilobacter sediminis TaxID=2798584 RepID=A0A8J7IY92_9BACT|nr:NAD(P)H-dependent oxidoreductase [Geomesophilobacter sediminis]MBJ6725087.1 NAD(P)H-dependent oxidoreductase [Geomesophilobacter sediminis]